MNIREKVEKSVKEILETNKITFFKKTDLYSELVVEYKLDLSIHTLERVLKALETEGYLITSREGRAKTYCINDKIKTVSKQEKALVNGTVSKDLGILNIEVRKSRQDLLNEFTSFTKYVKTFRKTIEKFLQEDLTEKLNDLDKDHDLIFSRIQEIKVDFVQKLSEIERDLNEIKIQNQEILKNSKILRY